LTRTPREYHRPEFTLKDTTLTPFSRVYRGFPDVLRLRSGSIPIPSTCQQTVNAIAVPRRCLQRDGVLSRSLFQCSLTFPPQAFAGPPLAPSTSTDEPHRLDGRVILASPFLFTTFNPYQQCCFDASTFNESADGGSLPSSHELMSSIGWSRWFVDRGGTVRRQYEPLCSISLPRLVSTKCCLGSVFLSSLSSPFPGECVAFDDNLSSIVTRCRRCL
jgi:hypothetical protein